MIAMRCAFSVVTLAVALAQSPNLASIGSWSLVQPAPDSPSTPPQSAFSHQPATGAGCYFGAGNNSAGTASSAFQFDPSTLDWTMYPPIDRSYISHLYVFGGYLIGTSEQADGIALIPLNAYIGSPWTIFAPGSFPSPALTLPSFRWHPRKVVFGSMMFFFGGVDNSQTPPAFMNDLWALDLNNLITTATNNGLSPQGWQLAIPNQTPGMPSGRGGHVMVQYGYHVWLSGGLTANGVVSDVWAFTPGNRLAAGPLSPGNPGFTPSQWLQLPTSGMNGGPVPSLWEATASVYGDHMMLYAGFNAPPPAGGFFPPAASASNDLWVFTFPTAQWFVIPAGSSSPWPNPAGAFPMPAGVTIGRHFWVMVRSAQSGTNEMWQWAFNPFFTPPQQVNVVQEYLQPGIAAGVGIAIVIGLAHLGITVYMWRQGGSQTVAKMGDVYEEMGRL